MTDIDSAPIALNAPARDTEVLVIGGGPAGASAGYWLSQLGHDVTIIEKNFPT